MDYRTDNGSLDEDGYTQLDLRSRDTPRTPEDSRKVSDPFGFSGPGAESSNCRIIAIILGILCVILLAVIAVLITMTAIWRSSSGKNFLKMQTSSSGNKDRPHHHSPLPLIAHPTPTQTVTATEMRSNNHSCPPDWIKHKKSCYLFMQNLDSWYLSQRKCLQQGARLLKIANPDELVFIEEQVDLQKVHSFWIGLSRQDKGSPWHWEDGSGIAPDLIDVKSTPAAKNASHNCVWIHQSVFYDQLCSEVSYFICEKRLGNTRQLSGITTGSTVRNHP